MKRATRFLSWICVLVMLLGLTPALALAALAPDYANGTEQLIFNYSTMSRAGAAQMDDWAMGDYPGVQERLLEGFGDDFEFNPHVPPFIKTRVMVKAMHFNAWEYNEPIGYYIPANGTGTVHEFTLYGYEDVNPADISITGVELTGAITRHVYGDEDSNGNDGRLYWYTVPIRVPSNDVNMEISVGGKLYATLPITHVSGYSPVALYTTLQVYDYEEGDAPNTLRSVTLRVSGFSLPSDPLGYTMKWMADPDAELPEDQYASVDASSVTAEDDYGYRLVTFTFNGDEPSEGMIWCELGFDNSYSAFFFGAANHLTNIGTQEAPNYAFRSNYDSEPGDLFYLGGNYADVPSPYYCIFKDPSDLEAEVPAPAAPTGLTAGNNQTTGRVRISWSAMNGVTGYNVYRAATEKGAYTKLNDAPVTAATYTDGKSGNAGTTYWYKVTAVRGDRESEKSAAISGVSMCQKPTGLKAAADDQAGTVTLTWDAPAIKGSVSYYRIYCWNTAKKAFEWIGGSLKAAGSATSFTIPAEYVVRGTANQYSIRGFNSRNTLKSLSVYSAPATVTVKVLPASPTGITTANNLTTGRVKLSWKAVAGAEGYNIYRAASEKGTYEKLNDAPVTALTYTDGRSGNAGTTYWYKLTTVKGGLESVRSAAVSQVSVCQRPTNLKATANSDGSVTLSWSAPAIKGSVSGYRVYLWDSAKGVFQWIGGSLKAAGTATSIKIPASSLTAYQGKSVQFSIRSFNTRNTLGSLSIYAAPATATVK